MESILYLNTSNNQIPELELYQIFMRLHKNNNTDKEVAVINLRYIEDKFVLSVFLKASTDSEYTFVQGLLLKEYIETDLDPIHNIIEYMDSNYNLYILITSLSQIKFISKFVDKVITIKKEELIHPL